MDLTEDLLHAAVAQAYNAVVITTADLDDPGPAIVYVNDAFCQMTGYAPAEVLGRTPRLLQGPRTDRALLDTLRAHLTAGQSFQGRTVNYRKDGTAYHVQWNITPVREGGVIKNFVSVQQDITREMETEAALRQSNADLESFAYSVSHDLQEPLRMVVNHVQLLQRRYESMLDARGRKLITHAVKGTQRMQRMIQGLLTYSRLGTRRAPSALFPAGEAVAEALANLENAIERTGGQVSVAALPQVRADRDQVVRLFQNLISNALKYRHPERQPVVRLTAESDSEGWVRFAVADNGQGMAEEDRERAFQLFQRLKPAEEGPEGSGVGLALCRRIVERHEGRLWVESTPGEGSTFFFTLPAA